MRRYSYLALLIVIGTALIFFLVSIVWSGKKQADAKTELPAIEFRATGARGFTNKTKALENAREIRINGGAGYVDYDDEWFVIEKLGEGDMHFSAESIEINLTSTEHKESFDALIASFAENVSTLQSLREKPANNAPAEALRLYNELGKTVSVFDRTQQAASSLVYSKVLVAANKQLLALFLLSTKKSGDNIVSAIEYCICSIKFTYIELVTTLRSR